MQTILVVFHIFLAIGLIGLILIQHGKGADMGAAFGSGASGTVFGSKGSASFLTRLTAGLATLFFVTSMVMAYFASQSDDGDAVLDALQQSGMETAVQPQTDLPPMPAGTDLPVVPEADLSAADNASADQVEASSAETASTEASSAETTDAAPAEATPPVENKE